MIDPATLIIWMIPVFFSTSPLMVCLFMGDELCSDDCHVCEQDEKKGPKCQYTPEDPAAKYRKSYGWQDHEKSSNHRTEKACARGHCYSRTYFTWVYKFEQIHRMIRRMHIGWRMRRCTLIHGRQHSLRFWTHCWMWQLTGFSAWPVFNSEEFGSVFIWVSTIKRGLKLLEESFREFIFCIVWYCK